MMLARFQEQTATVQAGPETTLAEALGTTVLRVRTGCNGNGSCGLCRVRILSGTVSAPTAPEQFHLAPALLDAGVRLACQVYALDDVALEVENLEPPTTWRSIPPEVLSSPRREPSLGVGPQDPAVLKIALDVGTTNLNLTVWDLTGTHRTMAMSGLNPQACYGSDIISRVQAAADPEAARQLSGAVEHAVAIALHDFAGSREHVATSCSILAVGNTAMLSLLQGAQGELQAPGVWPSPTPYPPEGRLRWQLFESWQASVTLVPPLGGFVGSDLLAATLAAGLLEGEVPALLVDFGTNTELALWDGTTLWVTSAAGGPAFEACGLGCAVPAEDGAIFRVRPGKPPTFEVIGGFAPKGVCGTGLVDWIACLVETGMLTSRGNFNLEAGADEPALGAPEFGIRLAKRDIDLFQRAKGAIGAGIQVLLGKAGIAGRDLRRIVTTGLFGRGLDIAKAQSIGLIPSVPLARVEAHYNLALAGCEQMLLGAKGAQAVDPLRARARIINLATCDEFEDLFLGNLYLGAMEDP